MALDHADHYQDARVPAATGGGRQGHKVALQPMKSGRFSSGQVRRRLQWRDLGLGKTHAVQQFGKQIAAFGAIKDKLAR